MTKETVVEMSFEMREHLRAIQEHLNLSEYSSITFYRTYAVRIADGIRMMANIFINDF